MFSTKHKFNNMKSVNSNHCKELHAIRNNVTMRSNCASFQKKATKLRVHLHPPSHIQLPALPSPKHFFFCSFFNSFLALSALISKTIHFHMGGHGELFAVLLDFLDVENSASKTFRNKTLSDTTRIYLLLCC